jgi:hypothetical protein
LAKKGGLYSEETADGRKHLKQALPVIKAGKRMFIDKPVAASLTDAVSIFDAVKQFNTPVFSTSFVRYITGKEEISTEETGNVPAADIYGPADYEVTHLGLFWYGVHGIELLFSLMGTGCKSVISISSDNTDLLVGNWKDGRVGTYRGTRLWNRNFGGIAYCEKKNIVFGEYEGYTSLLKEIVRFFRTGVVPISPEETLEIVAFMEAARTSRQKFGLCVNLSI